MKKTNPTPQQPKAPRWPLAFYAVAGLLLVWGQVLMSRGKFAMGLLVSVAGVLVGGAAYAAPLLPWARIGALAAGVLGGLRQLRFNREAMTRGLAGLRKRQADRAAGPAFELKVFSDDHLRLSRLWLLVPAVVLAIFMQMALMGGSIVRASFLLVGMGLFLAVYFQDMGKALVLPHANRNLLSLLLFLSGLPFTLYGVSLLWAYKYEFTGWGLTTLGGAISLWTLAKRPFVFEEEPGEAPVLGYYPQPKPWLDKLGVKGALVAAAVACAYLAINVFGIDKLGLALTATIVGILLLMGSFPWFDKGLLEAGFIPAPLRAPTALLFAAGGFFTAVHGQKLMDGGATTPALWYFLFGAVLCVVGLGHYPGEVRPDGARADGNYLAAGPEPVWARKGEWIFLALFMLVVFQVRAWNLDLFPWGAEGDEAGGGVFAMDVLKHRYENPIITENVPLHFFAITGFFFKFFGLSIGVMRWHVAIFGTLSVIALFFFLRLFFGRWVAFLATLLMAWSHWHLHYSRFGHYMAEQLFCQTVAFYFVFKGMRTGKLWHWAVGGVAFGLAMLPAVASRVLPFQGIALLIYFFVARRDLLRRHVTGFLAFVVASWMVASPALVYWARVIPLSMGRAQSVSIFDKTNTNAPVDTLSGFVSNCKVNMLMFNKAGDSRHRNNPLPNEKMLETWTAVLFALAFAYTLYHWRDTLSFFLIAAFFINLATSVFSVEAPQSHRTSPNIPILFSMIAILLWDVRRAFLGLGRKAGAVLFVAVLLPVFVFFSYKAGMRYFKDARGLAYDVAPSYVALRAGQVGKPEDQALFWATGFASSHPPVLLFKQDVPMGNYYNIADYFPVSLEPGRRHLLFLVDDYQGYKAWVHSLYPKAAMEAIPDVRGGQDVATFFNVSAEDIAAIQGLNAEARTDAGPRSLTGVALALPQPALAGARSVRFNGSLRMHWFGIYTFRMSGKGDARVLINGRLAYERSGGRVTAPSLRLPRGLSRIEAELKPASAADEMKLAFSGLPHPARQLYSLRSATDGQVDRNMLFGWAPQGLYGRYYLNRVFKDDAVMEYVEPSLLAHWLDSPFPGGWSAVWKGRIKVPVSGAYQFQFNANGAYSEIEVGGKTVFRLGSSPLNEMPKQLVPSVQLTAGVSVPFEVRFSTAGQSWVGLNWVTPDGKTGLVPPDVLEPAL